MDQLRYFTFNHELLEISVHLTHLAEGPVAGGAADCGQVTYVLSRNNNVDCFEDRGAIFNIIEVIY
jgi:hypothetical protein